MSIFVQKEGKKILPGSIYIKILVFLGLVLLSAVVMQPVQYALGREMIKIRINLIEKLEDFTGFTLRYSSMRPSFFGSFNINNLSLNNEDKSFFTVSRIKIHFSLPELILHKKIIINTIQIDRPEINIDTVKDADTLNFFTSIIDNIKNNGNEINLQQITEFLPQKADYQIRHLNLNIKDIQTEYKIENMNLIIKEEDGEITLFGRFNAELKKSGFFERTVYLDADAGINGVFSPDNENGEAELSFFNLTCFEQAEIEKTASFLKPLPGGGKDKRRLFNLLPFKTVLSYNDNLLKVEPAERDELNNYYFSYNTGSKGIHAGIKLEDFKPGNLVNLSDYVININEILLMRIMGDSSFVYQNGVIDYRINIKSAQDELSEKKDLFAVDIYGNEKEIIVNDFFISSTNKENNIFLGSMGLSGNLHFMPLFSQGTAYFDNFSLTGKEVFNASFDISSNEGDILISSEEIEIAQTIINELTIFLYPGEKETEISVSGIFSESGAVYMDAIFNGNPREIEASFTIDSLSLFDITEILKPFSDFLYVPAITAVSLKNSSIKTDIFFSTDFNNIIYNAPNIELNFGNINGLFSLSGTDRQITLSEGIIFQDDNELIFSSGLNFSNPMDLTFTFNASYQDINWLLEGQILDRTTLIVRDANGFHGYGNVTNNGALSGYIEGINYPVFVNSQTLLLNFYSSLRYDSFDFWRLDINYFTARYANVNDETEIFRISGLADQDGASFNEIKYIDAAGALFGNADFSWNTDFSFLDFNINITDGREAGEYYYTRGIIKDKNIDVRFSISDMRVNRFLKESRPVILSADASILWDSIDSFNAAINLSSLRTRIEDKNLFASVKLNFSNDELFVNDLRFDFAQLKTYLSELKFNITDGIIASRAEIRGAVLERNIEGNIGIDAGFDKVNSWFEINKILSNFSGKLSVDNFSFGNIKNEEFKLEFSSNNGAVSVKGGKNDMIRFEMDSDGTFFAGTTAPLPIHGNLAGTFKNGIINAQNNYFFIDMPSLFGVFSTQKEFFITGGYITGKSDLNGPFWNPEFHGTARATSLRFKVPNFITEDILVAPFDVLAEGYEMTFDPVQVLSGNGGGTVGGWFYFENWSPVNIGLEVSIPREKAVPYGINVFGFLADGTASGNLSMAIDTNNMIMDMKGEIFTNEADLSLNMDDIFTNMENENSDIIFHTVIDLKVTAGSMVEFVWPATSPILRATPEMGSVILINSDTQAGHYSLNSNIKIRSGELYYFDRSFFIRQGSMVFRENETQFDPRISARAEIRDRSESGPVTISMIIENQPLFSFEPRFESSPGLTQLEIYSILGQNFNNIQGEENSELATRFLLTSGTDLVMQLIASSEVMSQFVFFRQLERQVRNFLRLDMFSVRTHFIQNAIVTGMGMGLGQSTGQNPIDRSNRVGNYFDNTTVFIGKYIGQDMFFQIMLPMRYDENSNISGGLRFEPDIGIELQSPLMNIRWDIFPNLENWRMNDNSITLSWSKSF